MEIKLSNGDRLTVPQGCKATVNGNEIIIEKRKAEFKDGDILTSIYNDITIIFKCYHNDGSRRGMSYFNTETNPAKGLENKCWNMNSFRHATAEERQYLFDKMKERGLHWDAEQKRVEKIRWRAKEGDRYWTLSLSSYLEILEAREDDFDCDQDSWECGNYFKTKEQAEKAAETIRETLRKLHEEDN